MSRWFVSGLLVGLWLTYQLALFAASHPPELLNGRTPGGVNKPFLVSSDGTLHIN